MKRVELPDAPGVLAVCYSPDEVALACRLAKATVLAEVRAGRFGVVFKPAENVVLIPAEGVRNWLERAVVAERADGRAGEATRARAAAARRGVAGDFLELHYSPGQVAVALGLAKATVLAEIKAGRLAPAYKPFERCVFVPGSAVRRWLAGCEVTGRVDRPGCLAAVREVAAAWEGEPTRPERAGGGDALDGLGSNKEARGGAGKRRRVRSETGAGFAVSSPGPCQTVSRGVPDAEAVGDGGHTVPCRKRGGAVRGAGFEGPIVGFKRRGREEVAT